MVTVLYNVEQIKAGACAESVFDNDSHKFWKTIYKLSNSEVSCYANSVGGTSGFQNVAESHFEKLYNSNGDSRLNTTASINGLCKCREATFVHLV